jgi:hypothetical protein
MLCDVRRVTAAERSRVLYLCKSGTSRNVAVASFAKPKNDGAHQWWILGGFNTTVDARGGYCLPRRAIVRGRTEQSGETHSRDDPHAVAPADSNVMEVWSYG